MYIYLSKKISMPNNVTVTACSWNREQGYVAAGGAEGVVKVIKLEMGEAKDSKTKSSQGGTTTPGATAAAAQTNLVMNQSLDGHRGNIACVAWNDQFDKLTTADINGMIIVWMNHEGQWYEEMINNRNKSVVKSMKWNSDGQQICIVYEDGAIIVGSVEGTRIWAKELKARLTHVEWSPDSRLLLFGLINGEVHIFDSNGNFMTKVMIQCLEGGSSQIASIDWYDGRNGFVSSDSPALAICYENGRAQIMAHEADEKPVLMDCQMNVVCAQWNHDGSVLAIAGTQTTDDKDTNLIHFYNPWGIHLKSLKVPGKKISTCSWEGGSLRLAITIDSFIYFANLRPDYKWCYFNNTIAYAFNKPGKVEHCIMFYDLKSGESYLKYVKQLVAIAGGGDYCALVNRTEEESSTNPVKNVQYILVLCNSIGAPLESKYIDIEPIFTYMNSSYIIIASRSYFYFWNYQSMMDHTSLKRQTAEKLVFVDNPNVSVLNQVMEQLNGQNKGAGGYKFQETNNPITCITASDKSLFIGRESGHIQKYSFSAGNITDNFPLEPAVPPHKIFINCSSTRLAIIDNTNILRIMDVESKQIKPEYVNFKRNDVWNVVWANDNPETFVSMEKTKMYIFRDTEPEEPTSCTGYICSFSDLQVKVALLDEIMKRPENPEPSDITEFDTKSLRDTRELLEGVNLQDAAQFIENNPHQKLWHLLAETALNKLDLKTAELAYVKCKDYYGLEFVKKIQGQANQNLKKAEISSYFSAFDEAESTYLEIDRKDLAYQLRRRLGDWFKVLQLLKNGSSSATDNLETDLVITALSTGTDNQLEEAYNEIGDYYYERQKYSQAVQYYAQGRNYPRLADCYYVLEDYDNLAKILEQLPENSDMLPKIAQMFESVGMCTQAYQAYLKVNNVKAAVDICVRLNQWDEGVKLAKQYNINQVDQLLAKQATNFLQQNKTFNAIELYRKARHYLDAAKLMMDIADKEAKQRNSPLLVKKLYVLTGLLVEQYRDFMKTGGILANSKGGTGNKTARDQASKALEGLLSEEAQAAMNDSKILDNAWRGAEAYHFLMLTQRQLRNGNIDAAFKTSMALMEYEDILDPKNVYSLIALCACGNGSYNAASRAFIKLENNESISEKNRKDFELLAFQIFSANPPKDKKPTLRGDCPQCGQQITEWCTNCPNCDTRFPPCIVSGRPILEPQFRVCPSCKHRAIEYEMENRVSCPLCHCSVK